MPLSRDTASSGFIQPTAGDALTPRFLRVLAKSRPKATLDDCVFGVFDDTDRFLGLVHPRHHALNRSAHFKDLCAGTATPVVASDTPLTELRPLFSNPWDLVAVIDNLGTILGAITFASLLDCVNRYLVITERRDRHNDPSITSMVFNTAQAGIVITDKRGRILAVNPAFSTISGYAQEDVLGRNPSLLASGKQSPEFYQEMYAALAKHDT